MKITFEGKEIEVEKVHDKGWEGIVLLDQSSNQYYLYDLLWCGGGYASRFLKITQEEYLEFESLSYPESTELVMGIAKKNTNV